MGCGLLYMPAPSRAVLALLNLICALCLSEQPNWTGRLHGSRDATFFVPLAAYPVHIILYCICDTISRLRRTPHRSTSPPAVVITCRAFLQVRQFMAMSYVQRSLEHVHFKKTSSCFSTCAAVHCLLAQDDGQSGQSTTVRYSNCESLPD